MPRIARVAFIFSFLMVLSVWGAASLEKANENYKDAIALIKTGDKSQGNQIISLLQSARNEYMQVGELNEEEEVQFAKLSSLLYWQLKFKKIDDIPTIVKNIETKHENPIAEEQVQSEENERQKIFHEKLVTVEKYETSNKSDFYNNMINYLQLQDVIPDASTGEVVFKKADNYHDAHLKSSAEILKEMTAKITDYDKLMNAKQYDALAVKVRDMLSELKESPRAMLIMAQHYQELRAMGIVIEMLQTNHYSNLVYLDANVNLEGTVGRINEKGLEIYQRDGSPPGIISWEVTSEEAIVKMAAQAIEGRTEDELLILAVLNLRLKKYQDAYDYFVKIIDNNPANIIQYKSYLDQCEQGYRVKVGKIIEEELKKATYLAGRNQHTEAIRTLKGLMRNYMQHPLSTGYLRRYFVTYEEIARNI